MGVRIVIAVAGALSVIFAPTRAHPSGWYVDASVARSGDGKSWQTAFKAIQEGINAASAGDTVTVAAGTYLTNVRFNGKNIVLRSRQPSNPDAVADTIVDGGRFGPVVKFSGGEDHTCVLSGFTIRNGSADNGGGICGGTAQQPTHATISGNLITDNRATAVWPDGQGGGIAYCDGLVEKNRIVGNLARHGGGLYQCNGTIRNNVIVGNSAEQNGGGLHLCGGTVELNTVVRNFASLGGGLDSCRGVIRNCIIWGNGGGSQLCDCSVPDYCCIGSWTGGGTGNLTYHPYFVDASHGDYHLTSWSPCIDAGDPGCPFSEEPLPDGGRVNMGAYGNTPEATCASSDLDSDGLPDAWELKHFGNLAENPDGDPDADGIATVDEYFRGLDPANPAVTWYVDAFTGSSGDGTSWETAFCSIEEGVDAAAHGDMVIVGQGVYVENIFLSGKNLILQSSDPLDAAVVANTVIDGGFAGSVVAFDGTEDERCALAGFTLQNGQAFYGGGIRGEGTRAAIRNNIIANNSAEWHGGGVSGCDGVIENNTISGNGAFEGAGLAYCGGTIRSNIITGNTAEGDGGGFYGCSGTFEENVLSVNAAIGGGGLAACEGVFRFNRINDNSATENGGAFAWCSGTFANNVIWGNAALGEGGGFFGCDGEFQNNTIVWNSAQLGAALSQCYGTVLNCIVWGNYAEPPLYLCDTPRYSCIEDWSGGGEGNINYNPYFVDEENSDFHLKPRSPCIDAGDPASPFSNEPLPNGGRIDLGAYGNTSEATSKSPDTDSDGLPDDWETEWFGNLAQNGDDDPDADNIPNLTEYYYAWDPDEKFERVVRNVTRGGWHETIQDALSASNEGDELVVYPGHYVENIHFDGKNVILRSLDPQDPAIVADTVIDGNQNGPVVTFAGTENESCVLSGFTIRNGAAYYSGGGICGGAAESHTHATIQGNVVCDNSGAGLYWCDGIIRDNVISRNVTGSLGGGLAYCHGRIQNNLVEDNRAGHDGGGLGRCNGPIEDNIIRGNRAEGVGGGVASSSGAIQNNIIEANSAGGDAGALYDCDGTIQGNRIAGNSCDFLAAALSFCDGTIRNNVISGNAAIGVLNCKGTIENNTVVGNEGSYGLPGGLANCPGIIRNCIIWGNKAPDGSQIHDSADPTYSCIEGWAGGGQGNIAYHPYFVDAQAGNYHLRSYSPCIDAGDPASDFSNEPEPNGGRINMGAYGNTPEATCASPDSDADGLPDDWEIEFIGDLAQGPDDDPDEDGLSNLEEYRPGTDPTAAPGWYVDDSVAQTGDGTSWRKAFKTIREGIAAAADAETVVVAPGTYYENIHFQGKNIILRSTRPDNAEIVASTIIDGQRLRAVVTFDGAEDETCVLWGFTIQRGNAPSGGGVYGDGTKATIRGNVFTSNSATAGAAVASCKGTIERNIISGNSGGGMIWNCNGTIQGNTISANSGPGLVSCSGTVRNNVICGNTDDGLYACHGVIENNTILHNKTGIDSCKGTVRNCIVWGNSERQISYHSFPTYCCIEGWDKGGQGNIWAYPSFADAEGGDFHLLSWSPCIDAGDPSSDFSNEPQPNGGRINMGAYGNTPEATSRCLDTDFDLLPDDWELRWLGGLQSDGDEDVDEDGIPNKIEYYYGWSPLEPLQPRVENLSRGTTYDSIQAALDEAVGGAEIVVHPRLYRENVRFDGLNVILRSASPLDPTIVSITIIDGGQNGPAVTFGGAESEGCVLMGFTIRNGDALAGGGICGGTRDNRTRAAIGYNIISGNSAVQGGGLAFCDGLIQGNTICQNSAEECGGGLAFCDGVVQNNLILANRARDGGGVAFCGGAIRNNTIYDNTAERFGGGLYDCNGSIVNCIVWENRGLEGDQVGGACSPVHCCIQSWTSEGDGNISLDPMFVNAHDNNYRLDPGSPCIDSGTSEEWMEGAVDRDVNPRLIYGAVSL
ncbi:MAG: right-handed parallel beta-helix repeat-containing protein, partial [bacterium]|nr:right-handed parallel beta-helix repeat-containing protein [bacterium]